VVIGLRPEHVSAAREVSRPLRRLRLTAERVEHLGPELLVTCAVDAPAVVVRDAGADPLPMSRGASLQARFPVRSAIRHGDPVEVDVDVAELTYFDASTGTALWHPA
jgi:multiple sugar transport system ATP-binding protein